MQTSTDQTTNPEIDQDRVEDTVDHFRKFGYIMFPQQVRIYENIASRTNDKNIIEAGCGNGVGSAILERTARSIIATDKLQANVDFARCLYPWIDFNVWDIQEDIGFKSTRSIVCIETIEHVANPQKAIENLINAATEEVWISTPNGRGKPRPPSNPYHVSEYTSEEMMEMIPVNTPVGILHWKTFEPLGINTNVDPLVYRIEVEV